MIGTLIQILSSDSFPWGVKLLTVMLVMSAIAIGVMFFIIDNQRIEIKRLKQLISKHGIKEFDVTNKRTDAKKE
jgi:hypothetical protein